MKYDLDDILGNPSTMSNGIKLFPLNLINYKRLEDIFAKYIVLDINSLNNKRNQELDKLKRAKKAPRYEKVELIPFNNLYEWILNIHDESKDKINEFKNIKMDYGSFTQNEIYEIFDKLDEQKLQFVMDILNNDIKTVVEEIVELLEVVTKQQVEFDEVKREFLILYGDSSKVINKNNFYEFRKIVMRQNILIEPDVLPTFMAQHYYDLDREFNNKDGMECDLEAMISFVSRHVNVDMNNITYYQFMAYFKSIIKEKEMDNTMRCFAMGNGSKDLKIPDITKPLGLNEKIEVFKKAKNEEWESQLRR